MRGICVKCFPFYLFINSLQHDLCVFKSMLVSGLSVEYFSRPFHNLLDCATVALIVMPAVMCAFEVMKMLAYYLLCKCIAITCNVFTAVDSHAALEIKQAK